MQDCSSLTQPSKQGFPSSAEHVVELELGKVAMTKQKNKRKEFEPETHRFNLSVKAALVAQSG